METNLTSRFFCLTSLLLTGLATAQYRSVWPGTTKTSSYSLPYGVSKAGGEVRFDATTLLVGTPNAVLVEAAHRGRATVRLFGKTYEAVAVETTGRVAQGTFVRLHDGWIASPGPTTAGGAITLRLAGYTVWSDTTALTKTWSKALGPYDLLPQPISANFMLGPVPIVVRANAGVGGQLGITAGLDASAPQATLAGFATAYAYGWASAGVGMQGASAGVKATLTFAKTTALAELAATRNGLDGRLQLMFVPIKLVMSLYAELGPQEWKLPVYEWSMDGFFKDLPLN